MVHADWKVLHYRFTVDIVDIKSNNGAEASDSDTNAYNRYKKEANTYRFAFDASDSPHLGACLLFILQFKDFVQTKADNNFPHFSYGLKNNTFYYGHQQNESIFT